MTSVYVTQAFYAYEAVRGARDEALTRVQELTDERDRARATAVALEQENAELSAALRLIRGEHCSNYTGRHNCVNVPHRVRIADYGADRWCDACLAADALGGWSA